MNISSEKAQLIRFDYSPSVLTNNEFKKWRNWINFDQKSIQFDKETIISSKLNINANYKKSFFDSTDITYQAKIKYFQKKNMISLEIQNKALEKTDFQILKNEIIELGNLKLLSLLIGDPSCVIDILNWWKDIRSIASVNLKVTTSIDSILKHRIRKIVNDLKRQEIRVTIYEKDHVFNKIIS